MRKAPKRAIAPAELVVYGNELAGAQVTIAFAVRFRMFARMPNDIGFAFQCSQTLRFRRLSKGADIVDRNGGSCSADSLTLKEADSPSLPS